jgi:hypothetical protein
MPNTTQEDLLRLFEEVAGSQSGAERVDNPGAEGYSLTGAAESESGAGSGDNPGAKGHSLTGAASSQSGAERADNLGANGDIPTGAAESESGARSADNPGAEAYSLTGGAGSGAGTDTAPKGDPSPITPNTTPTGNTGITAESVATTVLESGLGIVPVIAGIIGLFEGGHAAPDPLTKYAMPDSIQFQGDISGGAGGIDGFDQMGMPRGDATPDGAPTETSELQGTTTSTTGATPPNTMQPGVPAQSMAQPGDPQWFMDHSYDIAQAVRSAMLNLNSINDVVNDL